MEEGDAPAGGAPAPKKEAAPEPTPAAAPVAEVRVSMKNLTLIKTTFVTVLSDSSFERLEPQ